jgi:4-amino-4-deoxy-L-arabinose transferase-like glycosyltransferase
VAVKDKKARPQKAKPARRTPAWVGRAVVAIAAIAVLLRIWHIDHGLPDFLEEAIPFKRAFEMWGWETGKTDWNPHLFHYPSLSFYVHLLVQKLHYTFGTIIGAFRTSGDYYLAYHTNPTPMAVVGRMVGVIADTFTVVGVAVIGERMRRGAGVVAAALVALSPAMIVDARSIFSDTLLAAFSVWALERMLVWRAGGTRASLIAAVVLIGLAAGSKYPGALLLLPLAWVLWDRLGSRGLALWPLAALGSLGVFLVTSPFVVLDWKSFATDFGFVTGIARAGHLGNLDQRGFAYYAVELARNVGWVGVPLLVVALVVAALHPRRETRATTIAIAFLAFALPISLGRIEAQRYLIPVIPLAAMLIGRGFLAVVERAKRATALLRPALAAALVLPVAFQAVLAVQSGADTTQLQARRWLERNLRESQLLVQEAYGASLPAEIVKRTIESRRPYRNASEAARRRFSARRTYHAVTLPLLVAGRPVVTLRMPDGRAPTLQIFPSITDLNQIFYRPELISGADYVLTSGAVRGRHESDSARYAPQFHFYRLLDRIAPRAAEFRSRRGVAGPDIVIYRLDDSVRAGLVEHYGALEPLWWSEFIPMEYRSRADQVLMPAGQSSGGQPRDENGRPSLWVWSLRTLFQNRVREFTFDLALNLLQLGRYTEAQDLAASILEILPDDVPASALVTQAAGRRGDWDSARAAMENLLRIRDPAAASLPDLRIEYARILLQVGDKDAARRELGLVTAIAPPGSPEFESARQLLLGLGP